MRSDDQYGQDHVPAREGLEGQVRKFAFDTAEKEKKNNKYKKLLRPKQKFETMTLYTWIHCNGAS